MRLVYENLVCPMFVWLWVVSLLSPGFVAHWTLGRLRGRPYAGEMLLLATLPVTLLLGAVSVGRLRFWGPTAEWVAVYAGVLGPVAAALLVRQLLSLWWRCRPNAAPQWPPHLTAAPAAAAEPERLPWSHWASLTASVLYYGGAMLVVVNE